ncbi:MAG: amidohydrolase family protein [Gaiellales bacterium]
MELHEEVARVFARMDALIDDLAGDAMRIDPHTHLGLDEDGMTQSLDELIAHLDAHKVERAVTFPLHDPDRGENYTVPNDRVLEWCAASNGRVVPFCRLNLTGDPLAEAQRAIAAGARGIKLHPRAQAFSVDDERLDPVFKIAAEHRLPILIHAGRGMPPIGEALATAAERNPESTLILAHAAIVDQDRIATLVAGRPNVVFDASAWSPIDLHGLLTRVPPEQLVWASDLPYGTIRESLFATLAVLCEVGADMPTRAAILGGTSDLLLRGERPTLSSAPLAPRDRVVNLARQRLGGYLTAMLPVIWQRRPDHVGHFGLAAAVCRDEEGELEGIGDLIRLAERRWDRALAEAQDRPTLEDVRETFELVLAAWVLAYSPATQVRWEALAA